jgi:hypothetical protein
MTRDSSLPCGSGTMRLGTSTGRTTTCSSSSPSAAGSAPPATVGTLTVTERGRAILDSGHPIRRRTWALSSSRLEQLTSALVQARFWSLLAQYDACHDCSSSSVTYAGLTVQSRVVTREPWWNPA